MRFLVVVALVTSGCWSGNYLAKQGVGQLRLLHNRRRIVDVLADPEVPAETKRRLKLAKDARDFGVAVLGLRGGDAFTRFYDGKGAPIAWNVTAADPDRLQARYRSFPIVGAIPYLGFFDERDARAEAARLEALGLDVYVRAVAGYSTLGITSDPIYSSMLEGDDARIVEVTLHEMTHATVYLAGHSDWNESLATVVGSEGAAQFFRWRGDAASLRALAADAAKRERDGQKFSSFLEPIMRALESLYRSPVPRADKLARRQAIFARARARYLTLFPPAPGEKPGTFARVPLNNAVVLAYAVYHRETPKHRELLAALGGDLGAFVSLYKHAVEDEADPIDYLARRLRK